MSPDPASASPHLRTKLDLYDILLRKWQKTINLVSPATLNDLEARHFTDSLQLADLIPPTAKRLYDIGSGAGFPGLVLAMARPDLLVTLIESDQRKCVFLQTVSRETGTPVKVENSRIEHLTLPAPDVITARALADLTTLLEMTQGWWTSWPDCTLIFPKGANADEEVFAARTRFQFDLKTVPSQTNPAAKILVLTQVRASDKISEKPSQKV
jgi:16S rRNA (guanine527-N7)-methyltransferase